MKKLEAIKQVQECMSSVFSKEDVINLINKIDIENKLSVGLAVKIKESIERELMDMDKRSLIDYGSAEFELSYNNCIELIGVDIDLEFIMNGIIDKNISEFVEPENPVNGLDMFHLQNAIDAIKIDKRSSDM
jgi:tRNA G10  N-methylase Trm11